MIILDIYGSLAGLIGLLVIFLFTGALLGIIAYGRSSTFQKQIQKLEQKVRQLQDQLAAENETGIKQPAERKLAEKKEQELSSSVQPVLKQEIKHDIIKEELVESKPEKTLREIMKEKKETAEKTVPGEMKTYTITPEELVPGKKSGEQPSEQKEKPAIVAKIEKLFLENWTGIIGAIITVVGIGFLGIFTALQLSEIFRFFGIVLVSVVLMLLALILKVKTKKWIKLGIWLQSMSAALFLLACAGAGGIPGLMWIEHPLIGLAVLCFGILANLLLAVFGKREVVASIHTLLSLAALAIAPQNQVIFIIAAIVTLTGVLLTFREKWEYHLLLTVTLFFAYIVFHYFMNSALAFSGMLTGTIAISCISIPALAVHYRKVYENPAFEPRPFFTHLLTWIYFGIGLYLYMPRVYWIALPAGFVAILLFLFAHRAKTLNIKWLYATDVLMSNLIAIIAILVLNLWEVSWFSITGILCLESVAFAAITLVGKDRFLFSCGQLFIYVSAVVFLVMNFVIVPDLNDTSRYGYSFFTFMCAAAFSVYHLLTQQRIETLLPVKPETPGKSMPHIHNILTALVSCLLLVPVYFNLAGHLPWTGVFDAEYLLIIPVCILIFLAEKSGSRGLQFAVFVPVVFMHISSLIRLTGLDDFFWYEKIINQLPLVIMDIACIVFSSSKNPDRKIVWPGIYLLNIVLFALSHFVLEPLSPLVPGVTWLIMAVCTLETARILREKSGERIIAQGSPDIHLTRVGWFYIASFLVRHILVHLQSERYIWIFKARLLIEIFALLVLLYLAFTKKPEGNKISRAHHSLFPLLPEFIGLFAVLSAAVEISNIYLPVVWTGFALVSLFIGIKWKAALSRFSFYSLFFYWASVIHVAFLTSPLVSPSLSFFDQTWIFSAAAILAQFGFIVFFYKKAEPGSVQFPLRFRLMTRLLNYTAGKKNLMIYYPLFISIALFLFWSFDHSILTLLLSLEFFMIFVISIILKESHFRYLSLLGLLGCVVRLVIYDLAASNIFVKAIVCIGVGILLIGMNALYNRFRGRYTK